MTAPAQPPSSLADYLRVLRRRKWFVALALALAIGAAAGASALQERRYEGTAEVLLSQQTLGLGSVDRGSQDPNRLVQTQVRVARVPELALRVLRASGLDQETAQSFLERSDVVANHGADILEFSVEAATEVEAAALATAYANEYTTYRRELARAAFARAERLLEDQLQQLRAAARQSSTAYQQVSDDLEELRRATLATPDAVLLRAADDAQQVEPRLFRNILLAAILGLIAGAFVAGLAESLDTRVRSSSQISAALRMPALGRVAGADRRLPLLAQPAGPKSEAFRMVRGNLELRLRDAEAQVVLVSSSLSGEGKTHVIANLALAFAQAGRRVAAVDLDLRRPELGPLLGAGTGPGVTDVATGAAGLDTALVPVPLYLRDGSPTPLDAARRHGGELLVLPAGTAPADPGEFVSRPEVATLISRLRHLADLVLIDTPPLLQAADAVALSDVADAVVLVVQSGRVDSSTLSALGEVLGSTRAPTLGFVLAGARADELPRPYLAA